MQRRCKSSQLLRYEWMNDGCYKAATTTKHSAFLGIMSCHVMSVHSCHPVMFGAMVMRNHAQVLHVSCRCEKRAQDLQLPHLFVFARLALAQFALEHQTGSDQNPNNKSTSQLSGTTQGMVTAPCVSHLYHLSTVHIPLRCNKFCG